MPAARAGRVGQDGVEVEVGCSGQVRRRIQVGSLSVEGELDVEDDDLIESLGEVGRADQCRVSHGCPARS